MAQAAQALQATPDRNRFSRFARLLISGGTTIIQGLFDSIHPPSTLAYVLQNQHRATLDDLKRRRNINADEWKILFPSATTCGESKTFDLTLLLKLLRNICNLTAPANGWDKLPNLSDHSLQDDLARIKYYRNVLYAHNKHLELSEDEFNDYWEETSHALLRISNTYDTPESVRNWEVEIDNCRTNPVSSKEIQMWLAGFPKMMIKCWYIIKDCLVDPATLLLNKFKEDIEQLLVVMQDIISPSRGVVVQRIYSGSVMIHLRVEDVHDLQDLWQRYKNGELQPGLEKVLITAGIKKLDKNVEIAITISEDEYLDAQFFFEDLNQNNVEKVKFAAEIEGVKEMTERLKELSLDIIHGEAIIDRGTKFNAHFAEVTSKDQVDQVVDHFKKDSRYADTTNIVWAYKVYDKENDDFIYDSDDSGEYLAGKRLQVLLQKIKAKNIVVIATWWQGEEYLYLDIYNNINERVLNLLMSRGLIESMTSKELAMFLEKFEANFKKGKHILAHAVYKAKKQTDQAEQRTEFEFIHSEVIIDHKSKFQAHIARITSLEDIWEALQQLIRDSKSITKAHYTMGAFRLYDKETESYEENCFDDGEIKAGKDLLYLLQARKVQDAVVLVSWWYGGVFIGSARFRHINDCALEVVKLATEQGMISTECGSIESAKTKKKGKGKRKHK